MILKTNLTHKFDFGKKCVFPGPLRNLHPGEDADAGQPLPATSAQLRRRSRPEEQTQRDAALHPLHGWHEAAAGEVGESAARAATFLCSSSHSFVSFPVSLHAASRRPSWRTWSLMFRWSLIFCFPAHMQKSSLGSRKVRGRVANCNGGRALGSPAGHPGEMRSPSQPD